MSVIVLPGQEIAGPQQKIGPGLHLTRGTTTASSVAAPSSSLSAAPAQRIATTCAGLLTQHAKSGITFVESSKRRYTPSIHDCVIGIVSARFSEGYRLDLGASVPGTLDALAFPHVNRKSKPNIPLRGLVYARVQSVVVPGTEPELTCIPPSNHSQSVGGGTAGAGGSGGLGVLEGGFMVTASSGLCRRLLSAQDITLQSIGERVEYEIVVGMNGRIWISAESHETVMHVASIIRDVEFCTEGEARELIQKRLRNI